MKRLSLDMRLRCALLALCSVICSISHAQKISFENIGVRNGLPASEVYNLHQDKKGYIWVFTEYGIVKYNGRSFVSVCKNLSLKNSAIYAVTESESGNIYIVNAKAEVYRIHNDIAYRIKGTEKIRAEIARYGLNVNETFITDNGDLWLTTFKKSYRIPNANLQVKGLPKELPKKRKKNFAAVIKNFEDKDATIISGRIITNSGKTTKLNNLRGLAFSRIMHFKNSGGYYTVENEIIYFRNSKGKLKSFDTKVAVIKARVSPNGHIWLCLNTMGLIELDQNLNLLNRYFESQIVSDILFDNQSGIWVSTIGKGIYHCDNLNKKSFVSTNELSEEISLIQEANGKLFIGTTQGKLFVQKKTGLKNIPTPDATLPILQVHFYNGKYYVATKSYLCRIENDKLVYDDPNFPFGATVFGMRKFDKDNLLVISPMTIDLYNPKTHGLKRLFDNGKNRFLVERNPGEYYTSTPKGICLFKDYKRSYPSCLDELDDKNVSNIVVDRYKNLWFSTKGDGVYCLNMKNILVHYINLPVNIVYSINFTKSGLILLSTNQGAFAAKKENINNRRLWKLILNEETLSMKEYENKLYIGTKKGLTIIDNKQLFANRKYKFYLASVKSKQGYPLLLKSRALKYYQNNLYFNYDLLDFQKHSNTLEFRLVGPTKLSGTVFGDQLYLQNLEPGEYKLEVYPKMLFGDSKRLKHQISFTIHPAFWQTRMFWVLSFLMFTGLTLFIFSLFVRRRNKSRLVREEIERQLVEYRLTALKSQINPHFMSNSLVAIQNLILQNEVDSANLYLAKFSLLLRSLLDYSSKSYATLKSELGLIELYVELEQLRFSNKFRFEVEVDPDVDLEETMIPTLVTQPFVENAIWHGLLPLNNHESAILKLKIFFEVENLVLSIIDNGVGREFQRKITSDRKSKGTELIANRIESMNQLYQTTGGKIEIIDLFEDGQASGTRVNIILPKDMLDQLNEKY